MISLKKYVCALKYIKLIMSYLEWHVQKCMSDLVRIMLWFFQAFPQFPGFLAELISAGHRILNISMALDGQTAFWFSTFYTIYIFQSKRKMSKPTTSTTTIWVVFIDRLCGSGCDYNMLHKFQHFILLTVHYLSSPIHANSPILRRYM